MVSKNYQQWYLRAEPGVISVRCSQQLYTPTDFQGRGTDEITHQPLFQIYFLGYWGWQQVREKVSPLEVNREEPTCTLPAISEPFSSLHRTAGPHLENMGSGQDASAVSTPMLSPKKFWKGSVPQEHKTSLTKQTFIGNKIRTRWAWGPSVRRRVQANFVEATVQVGWG